MDVNHWYLASLSFFPSLFHLICFHLAVSFFLFPSFFLVFNLVSNSWNLFFLFSFFSPYPLNHSLSLLINIEFSHAIISYTYLPYFYCPTPLPFPYPIPTILNVQFLYLSTSVKLPHHPLETRVGSHATLAERQIGLQLFLTHSNTGWFVTEIVIFLLQELLCFTRGSKRET
jgi:hypothetical protein